MKTGIELIAEERQEQIEKHGRTIKEDAKYNCSQQLTMGAEALICNNGAGDWNKFPMRWDDTICAKMINKPYKERLIIAGALIAAEIDRIQALQSAASESAY